MNDGCICDRIYKYMKFISFAAVGVMGFVFVTAVVVLLCIKTVIHERDDGKGGRVRYDYTITSANGSY